MAFSAFFWKKKNDYYDLSLSVFKERDISLSALPWEKYGLISYVLSARLCSQFEFSMEFEAMSKTLITVKPRKKKIFQPTNNV